MLFLTMSSSLLLLQSISLSCTVVPNTLSRRRCLLWALSTPRTPVCMENSMLTCGCTTGALHSIWMRLWLSSGPAFWSEPLRPLPLQTWVFQIKLLHTSEWQYFNNNPIIPNDSKLWMDFFYLNWHSWSYVSCLCSAPVLAHEKKLW